MKIRRFLLSALLTLLTLGAFSQEDENQRTIFGSGNGGKDIDVGFAGTIRLGGGSLDDRGAFCIGADMGVILDHVVEIGAFADGFITESFTDSYLDDKYQYNAAVGGLYVKPIFLHQSPIHFAIPVRLGIGSCEYTNDKYDDWTDNRHYYRDCYRQEDDCTIMTLEPGVMLELNVVKNFHISLGASYKLINKLDLKYSKTKQPIIDKTGLNGFYYTINCSFGIF